MEAPVVSPLSAAPPRADGASDLGSNGDLSGWGSLQTMEAGGVKTELIIVDTAQWGAVHQMLLGMHASGVEGCSSVGNICNCAIPWVVAAFCQWTFVVYVFNESSPGGLSFPASAGAPELALVCGNIAFFFSMLQDVSGPMIRNAYLLRVGHHKWSVCTSAIARFLVYHDAVLTIALTITGVLFIRCSEVATDVVLNCVALKFVSDLDEIILAYLQRFGDASKDTAYNRVPAWTQPPWESETDGYLFFEKNTFWYWVFMFGATFTGTIPIIPVGLALLAAYM